MVTGFHTSVRFKDPAQCTADVRAALASHRVVHLTDVPADIEHGAFYHALATQLGTFHFKDEDAATASLERDGWLDIRYDPASVDRSPYRYGDTRMPLHIDGAYTDVDFDVFFFYCAEAARFGGATVVADGMEICAYLSACAPDLLRQLLDTPVVFEKGHKRRTSPIIHYEGGLPVFNWSSTRVSRENPAHVREMAQRFADFCEQRIVDGGLARPVLLARGEAVFAHNRYVLHGRTSFFGNRCLMKGVLRFTPEEAEPRQVPAGTLA